MHTITVSVLISLLLTSVYSVGTPYTHHAILSPDQTGVAATASSSHVSSAVSSAWGAAIISFNMNTLTLNYTIVSNVSDTLYAHIHGPASPGVSAGVLITIPGYENMAAGLPTATGSVVLTAQQAQYVSAGLTYINIHTNTYPNGEIRGQILGNGKQVTVLTAAQDGAASNASGFALLNLDSATNNLTTVVVHDVSSPIYAHIHGPANPGQTAGVLLTLAGSADTSVSPMVNSFVLTSDQVAQMQAGLWYINVHSTPYPGGEIRGQIDPFVNYVAELNGAQDGQTTNMYGVGLVALYGNQLSSKLYHTVADATAAHIHEGDVGVAGNVIFPFASPSSPIIQNFTSTSAYTTELQNGMTYYNVHTPAAPAGLIRGQIYAKQMGTNSPTVAPTAGPTAGPTTTGPTTVPTSAPTSAPTPAPTRNPTTTSAPSSSSASIIIINIVVVTVSIMFLLA